MQRAQTTLKTVLGEIGQADLPTQKVGGAARTNHHFVLIRPGDSMSATMEASLDSTRPRLQRSTGRLRLDLPSSLDH